MAAIKVVRYVKSASPEGDAYVPSEEWETSVSYYSTAEALIGVMTDNGERPEDRFSGMEDWEMGTRLQWLREALDRDELDEELFISHGADGHSTVSVREV